MIACRYTKCVHYLKVSFTFRSKTLTTYTFNCWSIFLIFKVKKLSITYSDNLYSYPFENSPLQFDLMLTLTLQMCLTTFSSASEALKRTFLGLSCSPSAPSSLPPPPLPPPLLSSSSSSSSNNLASRFCWGVSIKT